MKLLKRHRDGDKVMDIDGPTQSDIVIMRFVQVQDAVLLDPAKTAMSYVFDLQVLTADSWRKQLAENPELRAMLMEALKGTLDEIAGVC